MKLCSIEAEIMRKDKRWIRVETIKFIMKRGLILIENKNGVKRIEANDIEFLKETFESLCKRYDKESYHIFYHIITKDFDFERMDELYDEFEVITLKI